METRRRRCEINNLNLRNALTTTEGSQEFWRNVLLADGFTAIPRWTLDPVAGVSEHEARIPDELMGALRRLTNDLAMAFSSVLLTAHAKVLGALSNESQICISYTSEPKIPLPLQIKLKRPSWREVLLDTARAEAELLAHRDFPLEDLRGELSVTEPLFETVFEL